MRKENKYYEAKMLVVRFKEVVILFIFLPVLPNRGRIS